MARAVKKDIEIKLLCDNREQDRTYIKDILDSRINKDGIKITQVEYCTVKPIDTNTGEPCKISTGDLSIVFRELGTDNEWIGTNLSIEVKKNLDEFSSLYSKENRERLEAEVLRAKTYGLNFYFVCTNSLGDTISQIKKVPKLKTTNCEVTHFEQLIKFNRFLQEQGFDGIIISGKELSWTIRRLIKLYIKENKLQYKC